MMPGSINQINAGSGAFKFQPEATAHSRLGFKPDFAAHTLSGFAYERKADASAVVALVESLEHAENALLVFSRDADAIIFEPEADRRIVRSEEPGAWSLGIVFTL